jgi:multidrug efflux system outer membrane protein
MTKFPGLALALATALLISGCETPMPPACRVAEAGAPELLQARESGEVRLNAKNLAGFLFDGNSPIHIASNRVHIAKAEVNRARADLLPTINLGALLFSAGQPQFAWTAIEAVVPFLIPGNWFRAGQARKVFEAEKLALQIIEQNQYASAFSLISLWQVDRELREILAEDREQALQNRRRAEVALSLGLIANEELNRLLAEERRAEISLARVQEMVALEEASIRQAFGFKAGTRLAADWGDFLISDSSSEDLPIETVLEQALKVAPESLQLQHLEEAAKKGRWSSIFAFVGGVSIGQSAEGGRGLSPSFNELSARGGIQLGFGYFPALELSYRNIREIELRRVELRQEFLRMFEGFRAQLASAKIQSSRFSELEQVAHAQHENMRLRVELGLADPEQLDEFEERWHEARLDSLRARSELGLARLSWQRALQEGPFVELSPCLADPETQEK